MLISFFFKETKKGFTVKADLFEMSIHKGLWAWAKTKEAATQKLIEKWNKKVDEDYERILKNNFVTIRKIELKLSPVKQ